jgi:hypothetical protein
MITALPSRKCTTLAPDLLAVIEAIGRLQLYLDVVAWRVVIGRQSFLLIPSCGATFLRSALAQQSSPGPERNARLPTRQPAPRSS